MTGQLDIVSERNAVTSDMRAGCRLEKASILPTSGSPVVRSPLMKVGMVIGYLGLVMVLSVAPFWHQVITPSMADVTVCTDFGGSR